MPRSVDIFEKYASKYDKWYQTGEGKIIAPIELKAIKLALGKIPKKSIEIGVGTGYFASNLGITYGIDPAFSPLIIARQRGIKVVQGYAESLPLQSNYFSLVLLVVTICFVDDPVASLRESIRILRNGGKIVISIVPASSPWGEKYTEKQQNGHIFYSRAKFYTIKEIVDLLTIFSIKNIGGISTLYQSPNKEISSNDKLSYNLDENAGFVVITGEKWGE